MKQINLVCILLISLVIVLAMGCKGENNGNVISSLTTSDPSSGGSGCRGRASGIKDGPQNLYLPYPNTGFSTYSVSQTWGGTYSHNSVGREHALDFPMSLNRPIWPVAQGRVMAVKEDSNTNCTSNCSDANYVLIDHGNGFYGKYFHFCQNCVDVSIGQDITSSQTQIGRAGNTGWSTASHLHFELVDWEENCTVKYGFANINSGARTALTVGTSYTSANSGGSAITASTITGSTYKNAGVTLTSSIAWYLAVGDTITIQGSLTSEAQAEGSNRIAVFLVSTSNTLVTSPTTLVFETGVSTTFDFSYTIPSVPAGTYNLGISKSKDGSYNWNNLPIIVVH